LCLWLSQGEGFKVEFLDYPGQSLLVKWKDLQDATALEIWRPSTRNDKLTPVLFGRPCSMESKCNLLEEALCAISGDLTQTLYVLLEYYKTKLSMYCRRALEFIAQKTQNTTLKADGYLDKLRQEIQSSALELFVTKVNNLYKVAIQQHYNSFHFINEPLLPTTTKAKLFDILSTCFPMHCSVLESICTTDCNLCANNPPTISKKQNVVLFHFLTLCRQGNKDYLCHLSMIETLAYKAKGFALMATNLAVWRVCNFDTACILCS
jgi:hypothetical protein